MIRESLEAYWRSIIRGGGGIWGWFVRGLLWIASLPYAFATLLIDKAYTWNWLKHRRPDQTLIISVGNLVAGGTGKTPFVLMLAKALRPEAKLAILSRGYRSLAEKAPSPQKFTPSQTSRPTPALFGDEPCLLMERLPPTLFVVGRHRCQAADIAVREGAQILLLDDGLQHRRLGRDIDIIMIDAHAPLGYGYQLPRGTLRESPRALARASLIVVNHVRDRCHFEAVSQQLRRYSSAPMIGTAIKTGDIRSLQGDPLPSFKGVKVGIFCGIANPEHFKRTVQQLGAEPIAEHFSPDHQVPDTEELATFANRCHLLGASWLICTEKDRVKLIQQDHQYILPIAFIPVDLEVVENSETWTQFLKNLGDRRIGKDSRFL